MVQGLKPSRQLDEIESLAAAAHVRVELVSTQRFEHEARTRVPQGVLARARSITPSDLDQLAAPRDRGVPLLVVVAGVTDPQNLGALLRSAECAGVTGIVLPRHRSVLLSPTVTKVAAGAIEHLEFALVGGIPSALDRLSRLGFHSFGLASEAPRSLLSLDLSVGPVALVVGGEERGLAPLVRKRCDEIVSIPQHGALESLNAGVAAAIACFEVSRQRFKSS